MKLRQFLVVWIAAFFLCAACCIFLVMTAISNPARQVDITGVDPDAAALEFIIIGSSLTRAAFPAVPEPGDLPWDGATQTWHVNGISDRVLLGMVDQAIAQDVDVVLVEASPLIRLPTAVPHLGVTQIVEFSRLARQGVKNLLGEAAFDVAHSTLVAESVFVDPSFDINQVTPVKAYWRLRSLRARASATSWLRGTRAHPVDIVMTGFPRPRTSATLSEANQFALRDQERQFAHNLDLPYFETDVFWEDAYFADTSHLNAAGRARYLSEFRTWWNGR